MSAVGATERTVGVHAAATTPPSETATATSLQVAPDPAAARLGGLELLFLLQSKDRQVGLDKGRQDVLTAKASRDIARKQEVEALNKAAEDGESGGFWSDVGKVCLTVAKVAAVVASVAVAVVSCGAVVSARLARRAGAAGLASQHP